MFGLFKREPAKKLRKQYSAKLEEAMQAQRNSDIRSYSMLTEDAQAFWTQLEPLERAKQWFADVIIKKGCHQAAFLRFSGA
ncbi:DUF6435 family protein [Pseudomonas sp. SL4(2022)]|uniref:DUF6435 family protein n=1 Tax=Pseudomonas sp. SL4(2022) TaxID=2994661 RepID=UPI0022721A2D|nr:DUF6435 family protein [Pseudomonas sp. SL4(2022)]WAC43078.1 DUF6435 family protein [Pseudomonas sp. SL4(2022)]